MTRTDTPEEQAFMNAKLWQRERGTYREVVAIREDGSMTWRTSLGDSGEFPRLCPWNRDLPAWSWLSSLDYEPVPAEEVYDAVPLVK